MNESNAMDRVIGLEIAVDESDTRVLSGAFAHEPTNFTPAQRIPVSIVLQYKDGVWAVDSGKDGEDDSEKNVLTWMGTPQKFPNSGYLIRMLHGPLESFEKEYCNLIQSAFLKYSFQACIGNMDDVFVAYHNRARILGSNTSRSSRWTGMHICVKLLEAVMDEVVGVFGGRHWLEGEMQI
ncbi:mitochondrial protein Pet127-domain-containing protein [Suillus spraguei]|nr:mitochondrial protein Pet127-domain-containing protein [Suillus spraguei]